MYKLIYSFSISILVGILAAIFSASLRIKVINSIFIGLLISDILQIIFYIPDIISSSNQDEVWYTIIYIILSLIFYILYIPYTLISSTSSACICKRCRPSEYDKLLDPSEYDA